ncbi:hypothetical protein BC831DRAFT_476413 [Entophlyctis helioformis]|nr:hypothetical protein BC831DRAFT_476413 [Entophlyctis helioformis]
MACPHVESARLPAPTLSSKVYKEECTLCFDSQDMPDGINVCMTCYNGGCGQSSHDHAGLHQRKSGHPLVLNVRRTRKPTADARTSGAPPPPKITKLAIQQEDEDAKYDTHTKVVCLACNGAEVDMKLSKIKQSVDAILAAMSAKKQSEIKAWEEETLRPCSHTASLEQSAPHKLEGKALAHCRSCDLQENLWLCLTCGSLGCGRQQYGGLGGNGHAMSHFEATQHPIAVKMGSITPEGTADLFCYAHGDEIINPDLAKHLSNFGINLLSQQKTEKSIAELQLDQNLKFDFRMTTEDGKLLAPMFGPSLTGLKNLGNSCYLASVLQCVFAIPTFANHYQEAFYTHSANCFEQPAECFHCQMAKLAEGLLSGRYSHPTPADPADAEDAPRGQEGIAPAMFKSLIGKGHQEFSTMRQQDAQEFLQHLMQMVEQKERAGGNDPSKAFAYTMEQRLQCLECEKVKYTSVASGGINLHVPATVLGEKDGKKVYQPVALDSCLETHFGQDIRTFACPHDKQPTSASFIQRFKTFPKVLAFTMSRFVLGEGWVMEKLNVNIEVPLTLDLSEFRSTGKQDHEELLPEDASQKAGPAVDQGALDTLIGMGFPEIRCKRAIIKTGNNGADVAMNWLFEHMEDPDIDAPLEEAGASGEPAVSASDVAMLMDMGFTDSQAKKAIRATGGDMERAVNWLFSHADEPMDDAPAAASAAPTEDDTRPPVYELFAFISHRGTSAHCGHYVSFVKQADGRWALFNDNKVAHVADISSHIGEGYIYFYKRKID